MLPIYMALIDDEKDKKAFEKLYNKYKNKVHAISLNILKNEQLAEESTSDTFSSSINAIYIGNIQSLPSYLHFRILSVSKLSISYFYPPCNLEKL